MDEASRVRAVAETLREPRSAKWIAKRAEVGVEATREHLERLDTIESVQNEETRYRPDPEDRHERFRSEIANKSTSELHHLRHLIEADIEDWVGDDQLDEHRRQKREYLLDIVEKELDSDG
jgi:predicted ArsR family transcriptional regulator